MLRGVRQALFVSLAVATCPVFAASALDFGYRIDGPTNLRPTLVFNDGEDTYIQPSGNARVSVDGARQDGPYLRLPGIPDAIVVRAGSATMRIEHSGMPSAPSSAHGLSTSTPIMLQTNSGPGAPTEHGYGVPPGFASARERAGVASVAAEGSGARPKAPGAGENQPPIIGGPISASPVIATALASQTSATANAALTPVRPVSYLAAKFGADGIRDGFGGTIQIHFRVRPNPEIQFASADGKHLDWSFDASSNVMTVSSAAKFVVRDGHASVIVSRETVDSFHYLRDNAAGLSSVFSEAGAVYLEVAEGTKKVTVRADGKVVQGRQKGRYYRIAGLPGSFVVDADGFDVTVTRSSAVHFTDQDGSAS